MRAGRRARPAYGRYVTALPYKALRGGGAGDSQTLTLGGGGGSAQLSALLPVPSVRREPTVYPQLPRQGMGSSPGTPAPSCRVKQDFGVMVAPIVTPLSLDL